MEKKSFFKGRFFIGFLWMCFLLVLPAAMLLIGAQVSFINGVVGLFATLLFIGFIIVIFSYREIMKLSIEHPWKEPITYLGLLFAISSFLVPFAFSSNNMNLMVPFFLTILITCMAYSVIKRNFHILGTLFVAGLVIGIGAGFLAYSIRVSNIAYVQILFTVWFFDMFSFFAGSLWTKIIPAKTGIKTTRTNFTEISPNKTLEGLIGGTLFTLIFMSIIYFIFLTGFVEFNQFVVTTIAIMIGSFYGDLFFSNIKRSFGIKDFSNLLYAHGGILDRVDSLLFAAPLAVIINYIYLTF